MRESLQRGWAWLRRELREDWRAYRDGETDKRTVVALVEVVLGFAIALRVASHAVAYLARSGADECRPTYGLTLGPQVQPVSRTLTPGEDLEIRVYSASWWAFAGVAYLTAGPVAGGPVVVAVAAANWAWLVGDPAIGLAVHAAQVLRSGSSPEAAIRGD